MASKQATLKRSIAPLNMNRLEGRMARLSNKSNAIEILFVGDLSANLEYWWGLIRALQDFGSVTAPDLPGIGGMTSFYKIGKRPTIDNFADYLASFVKLCYRRRRIVIIGVGFGFVVATRMLARSPEIASRVNLLVSLGGYADHDDFTTGRKSILTYKLLGTLFSKRLTSALLRATVYNERLLRLQYGRRFGPTKSAAAQVLAANELKRWQSSDLRTFGAVVSELTSFSNCSSPLKISTCHVYLSDKATIRNRVEQHLRVIFDDLTLISTSKRNKYALKQDKRSAAYFLPKELKRKLRSV